MAEKKWLKKTFNVTSMGHFDGKTSFLINKILKNPNKINIFMLILSKKTLNNRFSKLGDSNFGKNKTKYENAKATVKTFFDFRYSTSQDCLKVLMRLNPNKPQGPLKNPSCVLRDVAVHLAEPLTFLFTEYLKIQQCLSSLKKENISSHFKKVTEDHPLNCRPIPLTPALEKVFETLLKEQIIDFVHKSRLLSKIQYGFWQKISTIDALVYLTETVRADLNSRKFVGAAFLDLPKAFDSIDHNILLRKLISLGFGMNAV